MTVLRHALTLLLPLGAAAAWSETITWTRLPEPSNPPEAVTLTPGTVVLTRVETSPGPTLAELSVQLARLEATQRESAAQAQEYARLQAQTAQAKAESEAIKATMAAATVQIAHQNAATEARMQERTARSIAEAATATKAFAEARTSAVAADVAMLEQRVSETTLTPLQVQTMAAQTVADATPQFQALALNTLKESKGYLQTIARSAVADADPAMQTALGQAVGKALAEQDSPAAFSMRKAIVNELATVAGSATPSSTQAVTRLGNDIEPAAGPEGQVVALDAARLRLGRLMAPTLTTGTEAQTAMLSEPKTYEDSKVSLQRARTRTDLMNLRDYKVVVHEDNQTLPDMLARVLARAEPFTGGWDVKWKLSAENQDLLTEKFSLDVETTFDEFVSHLAQYVVNDRGVKLSFSLFDRERVVLVSD